jgi:hypothetical protein
LPSARVRVKTFDTDWIENGSSASPATWTTPSAVATAMPNRAGSALASSGI